MPHRYAQEPAAPREPDRLVVLTFAEEHLAFSLRELLCELEEDGVLEIGDAVVATRNAKGKVRLHQSFPLVPGTSALFVIVRKTKPDELLERLKSFAGKARVLLSTMTVENETLLRGLLECALPTPPSHSQP